MKKGYIILLLMVVLCVNAHAQAKGVSQNNFNESVQALKWYFKQIINKSIYYNYYLGDDLYTERSFINEAKVSIINNNQVELYIYLTTQKYDVHSSVMIRSEHGESVVFDPSSIGNIKLKGKLSDYSKSELGLLVINFTKEVEKHNYLQKKKNEDPTLLDAPLVYEFELPYLKSDTKNPEALQNVFEKLREVKN